MRKRGTPKSHPLSPAEVARKMRATKKVGGSILLVWEAFVICLTFFYKGTADCRKSVWTTIKSILIDVLEPHQIQDGAFNSFKGRYGQMMLNFWSAVELQTYKKHYAGNERIIESCVAGDKIDFTKSNVAIADLYSILRGICMEYVGFIRASWTEKHDEDLRRVTTKKLCHFLLTNIVGIEAYTAMPNRARLMVQDVPKKTIEVPVKSLATSNEESLAAVLPVSADIPEVIPEVLSQSSATSKAVQAEQGTMDGYRWGIDPPPPPRQALEEKPYMDSTSPRTPLGEMIAADQSELPPEIQGLTGGFHPDGQLVRRPDDLLLGDHSSEAETVEVGSTT